MCIRYNIRPGKGQGKLLLVFDGEVDPLFGGRELQVVDASFDGGGGRQDRSSKRVFGEEIFVVKEGSPKVDGFLGRGKRDFILCLRKKGNKKEEGKESFHRGKDILFGSISPKVGPACA